MDEAVDFRRPLGSLLVERGLITAAQLEQALAAQQESGWRLGEILVSRGWLSLAALHRVLAEQNGIELGTERGLRSRLQSSERRRTLP